LVAALLRCAHLAEICGLIWLWLATLCCELKITSADAANHYKFTGKERDAESGLDYFGARYYENSIGRFMSRDPKTMSKQRMLDPQQWNMYQYSRDNPISMFDPDGREVTTALTGQDYKDLINALAQSYRKESFRSAFKKLKDGPMVHEFGKKTTTYTPVAPGSVVTKADPAQTTLLGTTTDKNGNLDTSHAYTTINVDLNRGDAPHLESHEVEHGVQAQEDPAGYSDASTKGIGSPEYDKLDQQAEDFADKVDAEKPTMSLGDAKKEVQKLLPEPKPDQKKDDDPK
jgi:RHS repeat-associated protein